MATYERFLEATGSVASPEAWQVYLRQSRFVVDSVDRDFAVHWFLFLEPLLRGWLGDAWAEGNLGALPEDRVSKRGRLHRTRELARMLFDLQRYVDFYPLIQGLRDRRKSPTGVYFEVEVAWILTTVTLEPRRRAEIGVNGLDYDFDMRVGSSAWGVEAKARESTTLYGTGRSLEKAIKKATSQIQVPAVKVVFVRVPEIWLPDPAFVTGHAALVRHQLRERRGLAGVVLVWDEWLTPLGERMQRNRRTLEALVSASADADSRFLLNHYAAVLNAAHDSVEHDAPF